MSNLVEAEQKKASIDGAASNGASLKWGVLATGGIAQGFCSDLVKCEGHEIVAVTSRRQDNADAFAQRFGIANAYSDYAEMLENPAIDVIYVATPHVFHYDNTMQALGAGKHVVCEKPIGMNVKQVQECMELAQEKGLFLLEAVWMNFFPTIRQAQDWIADGKIGKVLNLEANFDFLAPSDPTNRLNDLKLGGGALMDIGLYPIFFATHILGAASVKNATCVKSNTGADVVGYVSLEHGNGEHAHCRFAFLYDRPCEAYIHGEKGYVKLEHHFFCGKSLSLHVNGQQPIQKNFDFTATADNCWNGYHFEIQATREAILAAESETHIYPHSEMLSNHKLLADVRQHLGIVYDD